MDLSQDQEAVLAALSNAWRRFPEQRLCQLVVNAADSEDPYYVTDEDIRGRLDAYAYPVLKSGEVVTDEVAEKLAREAEAGYDIYASQVRPGPGHGVEE